MGLILWPLHRLPPIPAAVAWFVLKVAMTVAVFVWAFRLCGPMPDSAKAVVILLGLHPVLGDLSHGNVNIFIAFLVLGALELLRRGRDGGAGVVLALAVACKVTPALFLPYLVWKRAWKAVAGCVAGLGLWFLVVPGAVLGWQHNLTLLETWYGAMVKPFLVEGRVTSEHANQSIPGVVFRLLTSEPSAIDYDEEDRAFPVSFHNLTDIGPDAARWVIRGFQGAFVVAVVVLCRARERHGLRFAAECSLIVLGMLLFSERTWKHHGVTLVLPFAVLAAFHGARQRSWVAALLAAAGVLTVVPSLLPEAEQDLALTYGTHTAAFLLLTVGVCAVLSHENRAAAGPVGGEPPP
jgi:hypothetical protein